MVLDTRTLIVVSGLISGLLCAISFLYGFRQPRAAAIRTWGATTLALALGMGLVALRGAIPDFVSIVVANTLVTLAFVLLLATLRAFRGAPSRDPLGWGLVAAVAAALWANVAFAPNLAFRIVFLAVVQSVLLLRAILEIRRHAHPDCRSSYRFTEAVLWLAAVAMLVRGGTGATQGGEGDFLDPNWVHAVPFLAFAGLIAAVTMGVFWIEVQHLQQNLAHLASHDMLTGLLNRQGFLEAALREVSRAERGAGVFSLAMFDLDHFKRVNDRHGHPAGDCVLQSFARTLAANIRKHDVASRFGGEEFALLMPDTDHAMAMRVADRVRADTEAQAVEHGGARIRVTVSGGVATFATHAREWDELLTVADRALYRAKDGGRNRVVSAGEASSSGTAAGSTPGSA